jgi:hypothetical protein
MRARILLQWQHAVPFAAVTVLSPVGRWKGQPGMRVRRNSQFSTECVLCSGKRARISCLLVTARTRSS